MELSWFFILLICTRVSADASIFQTSLNMPGFSLTLMLLPPSSSDDAPPSDVILRLLDASTSAPGWKWTSGAAPSAPSAPPPVLPSERAADQGQRVRAQDVNVFDRSVERICNALDKAEPEITKMDTVAGDGDCGLTLQTGANGTLATTPTNQLLRLTIPR